MGKIGRNLLAACAAVAIAGGAQASTTLQFTGVADTINNAGVFDERHATFSGSGTFATDISTGTYTQADLTSFSLNLHAFFHPAVAPAGFFVTADYTYTLSDLSGFSLTLLNDVPVAATWSLTPKLPYQSSPSGFHPLLGMAVDAGQNQDTPPLFITQLVNDQIFNVIPGDFTGATLTRSTDGTTSAAPEPASWMLMVGGFGMAGAAMRSRRKTAVSFA